VLFIFNTSIKLSIALDNLATSFLCLIWLLGEPGGADASVLLSFREKLARREGRLHLEACFFRTVRKALLSRTLYLYMVTILRHRLKSRTGLFQSIFEYDQHE